MGGERRSRSKVDVHLAVVHVIMMGDTTGKLPIGDRYGGSVAGTLVCRLPGKMCGVSSLNLGMFWSFREVGGDMHTIIICKISYIGK